MTLCGLSKASEWDFNNPCEDSGIKQSISTSEKNEFNKNLNFNKNPNSNGNLNINKLKIDLNSKSFPNPIPQTLPPTFSPLKANFFILQTSDIMINRYDGTVYTNGLITGFPGRKYNLTVVGVFESASYATDLVVEVSRVNLFKPMIVEGLVDVGVFVNSGGGDNIDNNNNMNNNIIVIINTLLAYDDDNGINGYNYNSEVNFRLLKVSFHNKNEEKDERENTNEDDKADNLVFGNENNIENKKKKFDDFNNPNETIKAKDLSHDSKGKNLNFPEKANKLDTDQTLIPLIVSRAKRLIKIDKSSGMIYIINSTEFTYPPNDKYQLRITFEVFNPTASPPLGSNATLNVDLATFNGLFLLIFHKLNKHLLEYTYLYILY